VRRAGPQKRGNLPMEPGISTGRNGQSGERMGGREWVPLFEKRAGTVKTRLTLMLAGGSHFRAIWRVPVSGLIVGQVCLSVMSKLGSGQKTRRLCGLIGEIGTKLVCAMGGYVSLFRFPGHIRRRGVHANKRIPRAPRALRCYLSSQ
jgi:hypothetical protein